MNFPIYVISLARATDRRIRISDRLNQAGVTFEIVDAVDGKTLDWKSVQHRITNSGIRARGLENLTANEIGCFLSHYNLWARMIEEQIPFALILEDDSTWDDDFFAVAKAVVESKYCWNVAHLSATDAHKMVGKIDTVANRELVLFHKPAARMDTYLIDLDGAKKMHKFCYKIHDQVDHQWIQYWKNGCYFYHVTPPPARQDESPSEIARTKDHKPTQRRRRLKQLGWLGYLLFDPKRQLARKWFHFTHPRKLRQK